MDVIISPQWGVYSCIMEEPNITTAIHYSILKTVVLCFPVSIHKHDGTYRYTDADHVNLLNAIMGGAVISWASIKLSYQQQLSAAKPLT